MRVGIEQRAAWRGPKPKCPNRLARVTCEPGEDSASVDFPLLRRRTTPPAWLRTLILNFVGPRAMAIGCHRALRPGLLNSFPGAFGSFPDFRRFRRDLAESLLPALAHRLDPAP